MRDEIMKLVLPLFIQNRLNMAKSHGEDWAAESVAREAYMIADAVLKVKDE